MRGRFITLEGGEGVGKTTLALGLESALRTNGFEVVRTREPGGSRGADAIRALLVANEAPEWSALSEALLFAAARNDHLEKTVRPALARDAIVICDRFVDSSLAYQSAAGGVSPATLNALMGLIEAETPDLTLVLDIDPSLGLRRSRGASLGEDRFEQKNADFHQRVRDAFLAIARENPGRCVLINAGEPADVVLANALAATRARLNLPA